MSTADHAGYSLDDRGFNVQWTTACTSYGNFPGDIRIVAVQAEFDSVYGGNDALLGFGVSGDRARRCGAGLRWSCWSGSGNRSDPVLRVPRAALNIASHAFR